MKNIDPSIPFFPFFSKFIFILIDYSYIICFILYFISIHQNFNPFNKITRRINSDQGLGWFFIQFFFQIKCPPLYFDRRYYEMLMLSSHSLADFFFTMPKTQLYHYQSSVHRFYVYNLYNKSMNITEVDLEGLTHSLLNYEPFMKQLTEKVHNPSIGSLSSIELNKLIEDISGLLEKLIQQKLEKEMCEFIDENNRILEQISHNLARPGAMEEKNQNQIDASFSDIHNLINEEKKKAFEGLTDAEFEKSLSVMEKYEDVSDRINLLQQKIRSMEDKYEAGFKSLWNVMSMTESALFDHIKEHKNSLQKNGDHGKENQGKNEGLFAKFWK